MLLFSSPGTCAASAASRPPRAPHGNVSASSQFGGGEEMRGREGRGGESKGEEGRGEGRGEEERRGERVDEVGK